VLRNGALGRKSRFHRDYARSNRFAGPLRVPFRIMCGFVRRGMIRPVHQT